MLDAQERRVNRRLIRYWEEIRGDRQFPAESAVDQQALSDIWASCFLVKVIPHANGGYAFRYTYLGRELIEAYGEDFTGADIQSQLEATFGIHLRELLLKVMETKRPVSEDLDFTNRKNMVIRYRLCMLPLGPNDDTIQYILGGMRWRAF